MKLWKCISSKEKPPFLRKSYVVFHKNQVKFSIINWKIFLNSVWYRCEDLLFPGKYDIHKTEIIIKTRILSGICYVSPKEKVFTNDPAKQPVDHIKLRRTKVPENLPPVRQGSEVAKHKPSQPSLFSEVRNTICRLLEECVRSDTLSEREKIVILSEARTFSETILKERFGMDIWKTYWCRRLWITDQKTTFLMPT